MAAAAARRVWLCWETALLAATAEKSWVHSWGSPPLSTLGSDLPCLGRSKLDRPNQPKPIYHCCGVSLYCLCYEADYCKVMGAPKWAEGEPWQHARRAAGGLLALASDQLLCRSHTSTCCKRSDREPLSWLCSCATSPHFSQTHP